MKRRWLEVAGGLLIAMSVGCGVGDSEVCLTYACVNKVTLKGSVSSDHPLQTVDVTYCIRDSCKETSIDVPSSKFDDCIISYVEDVCLEQRDDMLRLQVSWDYAQAEPLSEVPHRVKLVEHDTGAVLLDETREVTSEITRRDNCHVCWKAEMSL